MGFLTGRCIHGLSCFNMCDAGLINHWSSIPTRAAKGLSVTHNLAGSLATRKIHFWVPDWGMYFTGIGSSNVPVQPNKPDFWLMSATHLVLDMLKKGALAELGGQIIQMHCKE